MTTAYLIPYWVLLVNIGKSRISSGTFRNGSSHLDETCENPNIFFRLTDKPICPRLKATENRFGRFTLCVLDFDCWEVSMAGKCEHKSRKMLEKKVTDVEELPAAYCATITKTTYELLYECKDCGEKWTESKEDTKFD